MDMSYATIPIFRIQRRIFREKKLAYMVNNAKRPQNHPIYLLDTDIGFAIFFTNEDEYGSCIQNTTFVPTKEDLGGIWDVDFDGSSCIEGVGVRIWMRPPRIHVLRYYYNISFDYTNNEAEYEAMILSILDLNKLQVKRVVFVDIPI